MSDAVSGIGTVFSRLAGSTYTAIAEVNSISGPSKSREVIDVTSFDDTDGYRAFIPGLRDGGEVSFDMNFTHAGYDLMNDDFESDAAGSYKIAINDSSNTEFTFSGYVIDVGMDVPLDDKVASSVTIKITGQVTMSS